MGGEQRPPCIKAKFNQIKSTARWSRLKTSVSVSDFWKRTVIQWDHSQETRRFEREEGFERGQVAEPVNTNQNERRIVIAREAIKTI